MADGAVSLRFTIPAASLPMTVSYLRDPRVTVSTGRGGRAALGTAGIPASGAGSTSSGITGSPSRGKSGKVVES